MLVAMSRSHPFVPSARAPEVAAAAAAGVGLLLIKLLPSLELGLFAAGSARLASLFTGQPVLRVENGWMLPHADLSIVVTAGCSATDFFLMVATLLAWRLMEKTRTRTAAMAHSSASLETPPNVGLASIRQGLTPWLLSPAGLRALGGAILGGLGIALPLSIFLNSLRIVVVAQAHRWFIDHFPPSYGPLLHMAVGVAIFLPSLIALNGLFHLLASRRPAVSASA